ncbi:MAG: GspH/FimT family pseudopilin [Gammaproteobacteria bacterium]
MLIKQKGFTLIELIVTMSVAIIVVTVGVPSFRDVVKNSRITAQTNEFLASVNVARSEAVKRGETMTLCPSEDGIECEEDEVKKTDWSLGLILLDASDTVVREWDPIAASSAFVANSGFLQYLGTGVLPDAAVNFSLEVYKCSGHQKRTVTISRQGHATVKTTSCSTS